MFKPLRVAAPERLVSNAPFIDGLRAVAILSVIAEHTSEYDVGARTLPGTFLKAGMHGVDLFFVISGFCLAFPIMQKVCSSGEASFDLARYAAKRIVRILPPYYIAIALLLTAFLFSGIHVSAMDIVSQMLFMDRGGQDHMLTWSFWTLAIEFRWYALFPIAVWVWFKSRRAFALIILLAICSTVTKFWSIDLLILPAFMSGIAAAYIYVAIPLSRFFRLLSLSASLIFAAISLHTMPPTWDSFYQPTWQATAFFFVVAAGAFRPLNRLLSVRPLRAVGIASYSIYLVHWPVIQFVQRAGFNDAIAAGCGIIAGIIFWALAERPFVSGSVRDRCVGELSAIFPRVFRWAGLQTTLRIGNPGYAPPEAAAAV